MNAETEIRPVLTLLRGGRIEGELPVVTIGPIDHLAEEDLETIRLAEFTHQLGKEDEAKAMIAELEQKLGITPADKAAAFGPQEPWEGDLLEALGLQPTDDGPAPLTNDYRRFNEAEAKRIDQINAERMRAKMRGNRGNVALAEGKLADIAARRHQRVELKERADGIRETVQLAKARGEEVNEKPARGAAEIVSRDGLRRLADLGHIDREQLKVGLIYRAGHEQRGADLKASQIGDAGGAGHDNDKYVAQRLERAKIATFVGRVDRAVGLGCISNPVALQMLRHVAGEGGNIYDFGKGKGLERRREAIKAALTIAVEVWRDSMAQHLVYEVD